MGGGDGGEREGESGPAQLVSYRREKTASSSWALSSRLPCTYNVWKQTRIDGRNQNEGKVSVAFTAGTKFKGTQKHLSNQDILMTVFKISKLIKKNL